MQGAVGQASDRATALPNNHPKPRTADQKAKSAFPVTRPTVKLKISIVGHMPTDFKFETACDFYLGADQGVDHTLQISLDGAIQRFHMQIRDNPNPYQTKASYDILCC